MDNYNSNNELTDNQDNLTFRNTWNTYRAFVDAVIPRTPDLAQEYGIIQYYGALDSYTDEFIMLTLDHLYVPLAEPVAVALNIAAEQVIYEEGYKRMQNNEAFPGWGTFFDLSENNRFQALMILEQNADMMESLPEYFKENTGYLKAISTILSRYTMLGYYSEWSGYGSTRLESPNQRVLEFHPISWQQIGYPGPSLGYRALRM